MTDYYIKNISSVDVFVLAFDIVIVIIIIVLIGYLLKEINKSNLAFKNIYLELKKIHIPIGIQGIQGKQGVQGEQGEQGTQGIQGTNGVPKKR